MPDFNGKTLTLGAGVTIVAPNELSKKHGYDNLHGTIIGLWPAAGGVRAEVKFDDKKYGADLFEGYEVLLDPVRRKSEE